MKTTLTRLVLAVVAMAALGLLLRREAASQQELDPLKVAADTHKLLFENQFVRVIEAKVPVGSTEPRHKHPHGITVYMNTYEIENKSVPDGKVTRHVRKFGTVTWSEATVHEVKNVGKTPTHSIRVELKM